MSNLDQFESEIENLIQKWKTNDKKFCDNKSQYVVALSKAIISVENDEYGYVRNIANAITELEHGEKNKYGLSTDYSQLMSVVSELATRAKIEEVPTYHNIDTIRDLIQEDLGC